MRASLIMLYVRPQKKICQIVFDLHSHNLISDNSTIGSLNLEKNDKNIFIKFIDSLMAVMSQYIKERVGLFNIILIFRQRFCKTDYKIFIMFGKINYFILYVTVIEQCASTSSTADFFLVSMASIILNMY